MLAAPAVHASALMNFTPEPVAQTQTKDLVVTFSGAFCFWQYADRIKVMVPPVGKLSKDPHLFWATTTKNSKAFDKLKGYSLSLGAKPVFTNKSRPVPTGSELFTYKQGKGVGAQTLLDFYVPIPSQIIGIRPTLAKMKCTSGDRYCSEFVLLASGLTFVYPQVNLDEVTIVPYSDSDVADTFKPCFDNDAALKEATLTIHLTPLDRVTDPGHGHATYVWEQMLSMYPWMQKEIKGIDFCLHFDPSTCPPSCVERTPPNGNPQVGPSDDCQVPIMLLPT